MILFNIQNNGKGRIEIQERVAVFAAFQNDGITVTHTVSRMQQRQVAADHDSGITFCLHHDVGHHGSGGGFTVGTGNADGILIGLHDFAPCLCTFKHRNAGCTGCSDFRVVIVGGCGTDDAVGTDNILGAVSDGNFNTLADQFIRGNGGIHIRTGYQHSHALQHKTQRTHGNTTNAHQMDMLARCQEIFNKLIMFYHVFQISR